jgi:hypothetical protein
LVSRSPLVSQEGDELLYSQKVNRVDAAKIGLFAEGHKMAESSAVSMSRCIAVSRG